MTTNNRVHRAQQWNIRQGSAPAVHLVLALICCTTAMSQDRPQLQFVVDGRYTTGMPLAWTGKSLQR